MIRLETRLALRGIDGEAITDFMLSCDDERYRAWWPGVHLQFHTLVHRPGFVGSVVYMDEYVGRRRLRMKASVEEVQPGRRIVWRMLWLFRLPVRLFLELSPRSAGLELVHRIEAGFRGAGLLMDPLWRLFFSRAFANAMDEHARTEFPRLAALLGTERPKQGG